MGKIQVNIQREDRLIAINNLSKAIYEVAKALTTPTQVNINDCIIPNADIGIKVVSSDVEDREIITHAVEDENEEGI